MDEESSQLQKKKKEKGFESSPLHLYSNFFQYTIRDANMTFSIEKDGIYGWDLNKNLQYQAVRTSRMRSSIATNPWFKKQGIVWQLAVLSKFIDDFHLASQHLAFPLVQEIFHSTTFSEMMKIHVYHCFQSLLYQTVLGQL